MNESIAIAFKRSTDIQRSAANCLKIELVSLNGIQSQVGFAMAIKRCSATSLMPLCLESHLMVASKPVLAR